MKPRRALFGAAALAVGVVAAGCGASTQATQPGSAPPPAAARPTTRAAPPTGTTAAPNASTITLDEFSTINEGMTLDQVTATVGSAGAVHLPAGSDDIQSRTWNGRPGTDGFAMVLFRDGTVFGKTQEGLS